MTAETRIGWLLDGLVSRVPDIEAALVLTRDGLTVGASSTLGREDAERLAAIAAGFHSLARGAVRHLGAERVHQIIVEMDSSFLLITAAGEGSCLAAVSSASPDLGLIAYEMAMLIKRIDDHLAALPRTFPRTGEVT
jgi:predicted regulator of Ras-like GTPase activity (Roadblock/LC7/MglB family)